MNRTVWCLAVSVGGAGGCGGQSGDSSSSTRSSDDATSNSCDASSRGVDALASTTPSRSLFQRADSPPGVLPTLDDESGARCAFPRFASIAVSAVPLAPPRPLSNGREVASIEPGSESGYFAGATPGAFTTVVLDASAAGTGFMVMVCVDSIFAVCPCEVISPTVVI